MITVLVGECNEVSIWRGISGIGSGFEAYFSLDERGEGGTGLKEVVGRNWKRRTRRKKIGGRRMVKRGGLREGIGWACYWEEGRI